MDMVFLACSDSSVDSEIKMYLVIIQLCLLTDDVIFFELVQTEVNLLNFVL